MFELSPPSVRHSLHSGRGFTRRSVELPCEIVSRYADQPFLSWGTDLSESGMFIESLAPFVAGEELVVCFRPTVSWRMQDLTVFVEVTRAAHGRRHADDDRGMGVRFLDLTSGEQRALSRWLTPRPRTMPSLRAPKKPVAIFTDHPFACRVG
jgi:hypothetical protein